MCKGLYFGYTNTGTIAGIDIIKEQIRITAGGNYYINNLILKCRNIPLNAEFMNN
jgi:pyruvate carboxylase